MSLLFFIFTLLSTKLAGGHVEFNHVNMSSFFSCNTNLEASHINIYISSVVYTILAIIQWVIIKKKMHKMVEQCVVCQSPPPSLSHPPTTGQSREHHQQSPCPFRFEWLIWFPNETGVHWTNSENKKQTGYMLKFIFSILKKNKNVLVREQLDMA